MTQPLPQPLPKILCVDDEVQMLESSRLLLRRQFQVLAADTGAQGLQLLAEHPDVAVVVSDMRMPEMDGAAFLAQCRARLPEATRILLTGHADMNAAIHAVNEGQIFRFVTKPCPPAVFSTILSAALQQHQLLTSERVLLEQTLKGCIKTVVDVLALASPAAFGKATRVRERSLLLAKGLKMADLWQLEMAAMLANLGSIALPDEVLHKLNEGRDLSPNESAMLGRVPGLTEQLLAHIPRLEGVREIIRGMVKQDPVTRPALPADVIRLASSWDTLRTQGKPSDAIYEILLKAGHDDSLLQVARDVYESFDARTGIHLPIRQLEVGMRLMEDLKTNNGVMLVTHGYAITPSFLERLRNMNLAQLPETVRVLKL